MKMSFIKKDSDTMKDKKKNNLFSIINTYLIYRKAIKKFNNIPKFKVIFKFDDLSNYSKKVSKLDKYIKKENLKVCWGIIGISLENPDISYYNFIKNNNGINYDFFNHGYSHISGTEYEFYNKSIEEQYTSLKKTQNIVFEKTGIILKSFGAPCNRIDNNTTLAIEKIGDIKYWFFGKDDFSGINISLKQYVEMEKGVGNPDFSHFAENLKNLDENIKILTLQGHPYMWKNKQNFNFHLIIKFLKKKGCEFIFPSEMGENNG